MYSTFTYSNNLLRRMRFIIAPLLRPIMHGVEFEAFCYWITTTQAIFCIALENFYENVGSFSHIAATTSQPPSFATLFSDDQNPRNNNLNSTLPGSSISETRRPLAPMQGERTEERVYESIQTPHTHFSSAGEPSSGRKRKSYDNSEDNFAPQRA